MFSSGRVGETHRAAVKAWKTGRDFSRKSEGRIYLDVYRDIVDVWVYKLFGHTIAKRLDNEMIPREVANKLRGDKYLPVVPMFSFAGYTTRTTQTHLEALGIRAYCGRKDHPPTMFEREVDPREFYSIEQLMEMPVWAPPPKKPRNVFVNLTMPMFSGAPA